MMPPENKMLNRNSIEIEKIIENGNIEIHFQPIVSIKKKAIVGVEGLCRCANPEIDPLELFQLAGEKNLTLELDRLCRKKALEGFAKLYAENKDLVLFLNFDISVIDRGVVGSGHLLKSVEEAGISPKNIIIEITEHSIQNFFAVDQFISAYKKHGFLFALDDFGTGHSNMERVSIIKPNILKIDRSLIENIGREFYKQEIVKSMISLIKKTGGLSLAEGVEQEEDVLKSLELGVDILQGFYFAKPGPADSRNFYQTERKISGIAGSFKNHITEKHRAMHFRHQSYVSIIHTIASSLEKCKPDYFDKKLAEMVEMNPVIECVYLLEKNGTQTGETIMNQGRVFQNKNSLFHPAQKGDDHSLKDYFLHINPDRKQYITEPYTSMASGNLCVTISKMFYSESVPFIVCVDIIGY